MKTPTKFVVLVILMAISMILDIFSLVTVPDDRVISVIELALKGGILFGLFRGFDIARKAMYVVTFIALGCGGLALVLGIAQGQFLSAALVLVLLVANGWVLLALADETVKAWIASRRSGDFV